MAIAWFLLDLGPRVTGIRVIAQAVCSAACDGVVIELSQYVKMRSANE